MCETSSPSPFLLLSSQTPGGLTENTSLSLRKDFFFVLFCENMERLLATLKSEYVEEGLEREKQVTLSTLSYKYQSHLLVFSIAQRIISFLKYFVPQQ